MSQARGIGRGKRRRGGRREEEWNPKTRLGRLVKFGKIRTFEEIFKFSIPIKEPAIVDQIANQNQKPFKEEVMKVKPVQKQTKAGQRMRFKAWVLIGDESGHIGLGQNAHKEVQGAIKGASQLARMAIIPVRTGYWGNKIGAPHTIPVKMTGKNGSVRVRLIPAPRGTGIVGAPTSKKVLQLAGIKDCYTCTIGQSKTRGNFVFAVYNALSNINNFLTPDLWGYSAINLTPFEANVDIKVDPSRNNRGGDRRGGDRRRN
jgi:ribosomal protein uS5